ncbi:MAG: hypothetical protein H0V51_21415 [Chloroflexi bacterium]|nr:hypothetical protein [Chloroflexota bacterium]
MSLDTSLLNEYLGQVKLAGSPPERREQFEAALGAILDKIDHADLLVLQVKTLVHAATSARPTAS